MIDDQHARSVRTDHYLHWAALIALAAYMWQLQGAVLAIALFVGLVVTITLTNILILRRSGNFRALRWSRWGWVITALALIIVTNAEMGPVQ